MSNLRRIFNSLNEGEFYLEKRIKSRVNEMNMPVDSWVIDKKVRGFLQSRYEEIKAPEGYIPDDGESKSNIVAYFTPPFEINDFYSHRLRRVFKNGDEEVYEIIAFRDEIIVRNKKRFCKMELRKLVLE